MNINNQLTELEELQDNLNTVNKKVLLNQVRYIYNHFVDNGLTYYVGFVNPKEKDHIVTYTHRAKQNKNKVLADLEDIEIELKKARNYTDYNNINRIINKLIRTRFYLNDTKKYISKFRPLFNNMKIQHEAIEV
ncbi:hypothetical protein ACTWQB_01960 [Piscibacillus sp. B03]|uniref:hypothetical protein n=1 Tax=Piscibacillus sp. B03 TaxID=3457430 RepID=UPI003FCCFBFA